jgi:polyisoprenyl-phosphate glycosyltransferase
MRMSARLPDAAPIRASQDRVDTSLVILMPVYDDWHVLRLLLASLDQALVTAHETAAVVVVNDASPSPPDLMGLRLQAIGQLDVLHLRRNLGHQRAICIGLAHVEANTTFDNIVIMDADGEDRPSDVVRMLEKLRDEAPGHLIFAQRERRSEGALFAVFYFIYRSLFRILTGQVIQVGNFSLMPRAIARRLVSVSEIWNHYASAVQRARVPCVFLPSDRGKRLAGRSTMNFVSLVAHGMSAISVHAETVGVRMLVLACAMGVAILLAMVAVVGIRTFTTLAIPGWATSAMGLLALMLLQTFFMALVFAGTVLHGRNAYTFLPRRDFSHFVDWVESFRVER